jgi:probable rRNA maturation factor
VAEAGVSGSRPEPSPQVAGIELDLAFAADPDLAPQLLAAAAPWCASSGAELAWQQVLADWLQQLHSALPAGLQSTSYSLGLSLVGDAEIATLNQDWRAKAGPTDVLAFAAQDDDRLEGETLGAPAMPLPLGAATEALELGDIVISLETAARQAPEHGNNLHQELLFLASHGLLHLLGWDHPDETSLEAMLQRQAALCSSVNVQASGSSTGP